MPVKRENRAFGTALRTLLLALRAMAEMDFSLTDEVGDEWADWPGL